MPTSKLENSGRSFLIGVAVWLAFGCSEPAASAPDAETAASPPDFELPTLDGGSVRLSEHLGREVVLLDFWATFCKPCLAAMPELDAIYRRHKSQGLSVFGISIDSANEADDVRAEVMKAGVSFPILLDQETRVVALYNPRATAPFSVLIGKDGRVIRKQEGYTTGDAAAVESEIERALSR